MQTGRKPQHPTKKSPPGLVRSPHDGLSKTDDWERTTEDVHVGGRSSDESSSGVCGEQSQSQGQISPRKIRKVRDMNRRKSTPRSPVSTRTKRRTGSGDDKQPSSLPGSLPRRRPKPEIEEGASHVPKSTKLTPYNRY